MKKKQVLAVSSALMIGTTTALTGLPTPVMAQESTEVVQEAVVEENKTELVPVEQETENAEVQENITDKEQEEITPDKEPAENAETSKEDLTEESTKQETSATPEKEVVTEDKTVEESKNTEVKAGSIPIDEAHFPDAEFRKYLKGAWWNIDGTDIISEEEVKKIGSISLSSYPNVESVKGIELFPNLQSLVASRTKLKNLDVSKNPNLEALWCDQTNLSNLDVTHNPKLETLVIDTTEIGSIDVRKCPELRALLCHGTNISELDLTQNLKLENLQCNKTNITGLDVSKNTKLKTLRINHKNEQLMWLNIGNNPNLTFIYPINTQKKKISISGNTFAFREQTEKNIDLSKVTVTSNGTLDRKTGIVTIENLNMPVVVYEYDCGTFENGEQKKITVRLEFDAPTNTAPIISANDVTLNIGDTFDPLANVTATDKEDGTIILTKDNIIANDVDTSKAGTYHVTYKVTDKNGASTEKTITVIVKQNTGDLNTAPTISANDVTLNVGDTFDPLANVTAMDKEDGTITLTKDNIIANDVDTSKAGTYHVTYKVTDKNGASTEKTITVIVKQNTGNLNSAPSISANDVTLNVGDTFDPLKDVTATDKEDGTITLTKDNIIANDVDTSKAGTYHVTYKVTDKNGASIEKTITVIVKQNTGDLNSAPSISANDITLNVGNTFDPLKDVTATDKEDGTIALTKDNIIANDVDTSKAGTYHVTYKVTDKNGASTEKTITVIVKQNTGDLNTAPTISANDVTLNVGDTFNPLANVTATDKEDGTIALTKDNIIANDVDTSKAGTYHVTYKITDKNGASTEKTITVTVKEKTTNKPVSPQQPQKPNKPTTSTKPSEQKNPVKTGDITNVGLFASMFAGSTGALAVLFGKKRKRNKND